MMKDASSELESIDQARFVLNAIRKGIISVELMYRASRDGWNPKDFHRHCDAAKRSITLIRSTVGYLCAGYTGLSWFSEHPEHVRDPEAFVCSLTKEMRVFRPDNPDVAIYRFAYQGPIWGSALGVIG